MSFFRHHKRVPARTDSRVVTKQAHKAECDINNIVRQYQRTGIVQHIRADARAGAFLQLPELVDYQEAMNTMIAAQDAFARLPAKVRLRFNNDPEQFVAAFGEPAMDAELRSLGLIVEPSTGSPAPAREQAGEPGGGSSEPAPEGS